MDICCVVVTYNRKELLLESIQALLKQTYKLKDIIIVDNNSNDGTKEYLEKNEVINDIIYYKLPQNIGGAGGFHEGIKKSLEKSYDWIWVMDDDTIPTVTALKRLIEGINDIKEEKISFVCSKVIGPNDEEMNIPNITRRSDINGYPVWMKHLNKSIVEVESATFVSVLINSKAIKEVGLPWKQFFIWGDDIEYTTRLSRFYAPGYVIGCSIVVHKRLNAKNLSIIEEENINRLNMYKYKFRNDMIISMNYNSFKVNVKVLITILFYAIKVLFKSKNNKIKKSAIVISSALNGIFNIKIKKQFKKRMMYD